MLAAFGGSQVSEWKRVGGAADINRSTETLSDPPPLRKERISNRRGRARGNSHNAIPNQFHPWYNRKCSTPHSNAPNGADTPTEVSRWPGGMERELLLQVAVIAGVVSHNGG